MIGSSEIDNEIIYSWCFNYVEYFDSTPFARIIILVEDLERFLSLKSQQAADMVQTKMMASRGHI